jgi:calcineurin-like phosphoesterase family protein
LIIGNHDKMPQDCLDMFKPDWAYEETKLTDVVKTMQQFREVHQQLDRVICGQRMTLNHFPMRSWSSSVHGTWCVCGHAHGRCKVSLPGEIGGGLILDVGWDVWKKPIPFDVLKAEMNKKLALMPQNFRDHVLYGKPLGRIDNDEHID